MCYHKEEDFAFFIKLLFSNTLTTSLIQGGISLPMKTTLSIPDGLLLQQNQLSPLYADQNKSSP